MKADKSNGYDAIADTFARARSPTIGTAMIREWARRLEPGAVILDIGCGNGVPILATLLQEGFNIFGVDASESLVREFRNRFPAVAVECNAVEDFHFFNRKFDAVVCNWRDAMTGPASLSLGHDAYEMALRENGLSLVDNLVDEGENYHYFARKQ